MSCIGPGPAERRAIAQRRKDMDIDAVAAAIWASMTALDVRPFPELNHEVQQRYRRIAQAAIGAMAPQPN